METSEFMKQYWLNMHSGAASTATEKANNRKMSLLHQRKIKRETEGYARRNIAPDMSPYDSPAPCKNITNLIKKQSPQNKNETRLALLAKWKAEKKKRRELEKANEKPVFKVCHVTTSFKLDLEHVNKVIKGKPIRKLDGLPKNHLFAPPKGLRPLQTFGAHKSLIKITESIPSKPVFSSDVKVAVSNLKQSDKMNVTESLHSSPSQYGYSSNFKVSANSRKQSHKKNIRESSHSSPSKPASSSAVKVALNNQKQSAKKNVGAVTKCPYNLRNQSKLGTKTTNKIEPPAKTPVKAATPKAQSLVTKGNPESGNKPPMSMKFDCDFSVPNIVTPKSQSKVTKRGMMTDVAKLSPFITIARGKTNARDEYIVKHATREDDVKSMDPEFVTSVRKSVDLFKGADYFMYLLISETERINGMCEKWTAFMQDNELPEEATSSINVAIGQARLLTSKKFNQFSKLISQCKTQEFEEKVITCEDLHGFWDMIYMQVEDLNKRFGNLDRLKETNWEEILPEKKPVRTDKSQSKLKPRSKKAVASSRLKDLIKAGRAKQKHAENDAGSSLEIPINEQIELDQTLRTPKRRSARLSVIKSEPKSRSSLSPSALMMVKVTQSIKRGNGLTPAKSILKVDRIKSTGKKSVAFRESFSENVAQISEDQAKFTTPKAD